VGATDLVLAAAILAGACWLLVRSFSRGRGPCAGCTGGGCGRREGAATGLVTLGSVQPARDARSGRAP
jgi:hypothetical protein